MRMLSKKSLLWFSCLCAIVLLASSCNKQEEIKSRTYFGVTLKYFKEGPECAEGTDQAALIERAYNDCFIRHGISNGPCVIFPEVSREEILEYCKEAEMAILTSSVRFSGYYEFTIWTERHNATYEFQETDVFYTQSYGIKLAPVSTLHRYGYDYFQD